MGLYSIQSLVMDLHMILHNTKSSS